MREKEIELQNEKLRLEKHQQEVLANNEIVELKKLQQLQLEKIASDLRRKLKNIVSKTLDKSLSDEMNQLYHELEGINISSDTDEISSFIPEFNTKFYKNLTKIYPDLSVNDRRLCVLLHVNMSTKEISQITKQSCNAIRIARVRLRSKLGITSLNISIQEFLSKYDNQ